MLANHKDENIVNFYVSEKRKKVWDVELDLLKKLMEVCGKNGIRMFLGDGSLLGAVRHNGFIPWDDDIDINMLREDYDKLMEIGPKEFSFPYFFQSAYTDHNYHRGHIQLRNSETTGILPNDCTRKFNQGIFIDIFPIDSLPLTEKEVSNLITESSKMRINMYYYRHLDFIFSPKSVFRSVINSIRSEIVIQKAGGFTKYYKQYEEIFRRNMNNGSQYLTKLSSFYVKYRIPKEVFSDIKYIDFQGISAPIMAGYDEYLKLMYGEDYMTPHQVSTFHGDAIFDTEKPYTQYIDKVKRLYGILGQIERKFVRNGKTSRKIDEMTTL